MFTCACNACKIEDMWLFDLPIICFCFILFYFFLTHLTSGDYFRMKMKILLTRWKFPTLKFIMKKLGTCSVQEGMYMLLVEMNLGADYFNMKI